MFFTSCTTCHLAHNRFGALACTSYWWNKYQKGTLRLMIGHVTTPKPIGLPQPSWVLLNVNKDCSISLSGYRILGFRLELYSAYWSTAVIGLCLVAIVLGLTKLCSSDHHFFDEDPSEGQTPPEYNHFAR